MFYRYVTAVTTAASGYSYWHYGRKTVRVLNTRSPWQSRQEPVRADGSKQQLQRYWWAAAKVRQTDVWSPGALNPSSCDNHLWVSMAMTHRNQQRPQMVYCNTTGTPNCSTGCGAETHAHRNKHKHRPFSHPHTHSHVHSNIHVKYMSSDQVRASIFFPPWFFTIIGFVNR